MLFNKSPLKNILGIITLVIFGLIVGSLLLYYFSKNFEFRNDTFKRIEDQRNLTTVTQDSVPIGTSINVTSPQNGSMVNGEIRFVGSVTTNSNPIIVRLYDDSKTLLGESKAIIDSSSSSSSLYSWSAVVSINRSPQTTSGKALIYFEEEAEDNNNTKNIMISFASKEVKDRLKIISPIENQLIESSFINLQGEMKGFFEGVLGFRLKDKDGIVIFEDNIQANSDNYTEFAKFSEVVDFGPLPENIKGNGSIEFYENSPKDGKESVLLVLPVRF